LQFNNLKNLKQNLSIKIVFNVDNTNYLIAIAVNNKTIEITFAFEYYLSMAAPCRAPHDNHDTAMNSYNRCRVVYFVNLPFFMFLSCVTNTSLGLGRVVFPIFIFHVF
jgi:hypothetical protein